MSFSALKFYNFMIPVLFKYFSIVLSISHIAVQILCRAVFTLGVN